MSKKFFTLLFICFYVVVRAQINLIADPGFDSVTCNQFFVNLKYWEKIGGPLVLNRCLPLISGSSVPINNPNPFSFSDHYLQPRSGAGYVGVVVYNSATNDARDYVSTKLKETLKKGTKYYAAFYVAPYAPIFNFVKWYFNDAIGMGLLFDQKNIYADNRTYFNPYFDSDPPAIGTHGKVFTDTSGWTRVGGCYTAKGDEKFATIGNFRRTKNSLISWDTAATFRPTTGLVNYFYIDDAIVSEFNPLPDEAILCTGSSITYDAKFFDADSYRWSSGEKSSAIKITKPGTYSVEVSIAGCIFTDTVKVQAEKTFLAIPSDTAFCKNGAGLVLTAQASPDYAYKWNTGATSQSISIVSAGNYSVSVTTPSCTIAYKTKVTEVRCLCNFYAPTAFSPNGDGINDGFRPFIGCKIVKISAYKLTIYNRFGSQIFQTTDVNETWDGSYNGNPPTPDIYAWILEYDVYSDEVKETIHNVESGDVTIVK